MGKKKKVGKNRLDKFYHLAKDQGYRSRASFKLIQLNKKFNFLSKANVLVDLCAAPGSWLQVASKFMPAERTLIGVDLVPIKAIPGCVTLTQDITTTKCLTEIKQKLQGKGVNVVLHDGAPNMGKSWSQDAFTQSELVLSALKLATEVLAKDGIFVSKIFRSADYNSLIWVFNQLFKKVSSTKPTASRSVSAEIFVVCEGYLCPRKIDPKLLDSRFVFKELSAPAKQINLFSKKKEKPNREGYADDANQILFKRCSALKFITSEDPVKLLAEYNEISFNAQRGEEEDQAELKLYSMHPKTTPEVKACLSDLRVLNANDFKKLLKWRLYMRRFRAAAQKKEKEDDNDISTKNSTATGSDDDSDSATDDIDDNGKKIQKKSLAETHSQQESTPEQQKQQLQEEMDDHVKLRLKSEKKKEKKRRREQQKIRIRLGLMGDVDLGEDFEAPTSEGLFNLRTIAKNSTVQELLGSSGAQQLQSKLEPDLMDKYIDVTQKTATTKKKFSLFPEEDENLEEEDGTGQSEQKNDKVLEKYLDLLYDNYVSANQEYRKKLSKKLRRENLKREEIPADLSDFSKFTETFKEADDYDDDNDIVMAEDEEGDVNPFLVKGEEVSVSKRASMFFNQNVFDGIEEDDEQEDSLENIAKKYGPKNNDAESGDEISDENEIDDIDKNTFKQKNFSGIYADISSDENITIGGMKRARMEESESEHERPNKKKKSNNDDSDNTDGNNDNNTDKNNEFDEVKIDDLLDNEEEAAFNEMDEEERAQVLALGAMLQDPQTRAAVIDRTVNRYAFDEDPLSLPRWFTEDEQSHSKPQKPVTKEMVREWRLKMKAIDSKTIKKVAEANARKKRRQLAKLEKARSKARVIAASSDMSEHEKVKQIQKLYKGQLGKVKPNKVYVVSRKLSSAKMPATGGNVRIKLVDPRMKKDKRAKKAADSKRDSRIKNRRKK